MHGAVRVALLRRVREGAREPRFRSAAAHTALKDLSTVPTDSGVTHEYVKRLARILVLLRAQHERLPIKARLARCQCERWEGQARTLNPLMQRHRIHIGLVLNEQLNQRAHVARARRRQVGESVLR